MNNKIKIKPIKIKEIAKLIVAKNYAEFLPRFAIIWEMVNESDIVELPAVRTEQSIKKYWPEFDAKADHRCNGCFGTTLIAKCVYQEIKDRENINESELTNCVEKVCNNKFPNINPDLKKLLLKGVNFMFSSIGEKSESENREFLYLSQDYRIEIMRAPGKGKWGRKGIMDINGTKIRLSPREADVCVAMGIQSKEDWEYIVERDPLDVGWVSYGAFRKSVLSWMIYFEEHKSAIDPGVIRDVIDKINKKIRSALNLKESEEDLIENGSYCEKSGHYRFRVNPHNIKVKD